MQSRQTLFFLIVAAAALFQSLTGAPTTAPSEVSQASQALSQAPGTKFVAMGATDKEQPEKAVDTQSAVQQAQDATVKDQTGKAAETQSSVQKSLDTTVKDQAGKAAETQIAAQQLQGAAADNSMKSQPAEQAGSPQQLVDAENRPEQSAHQKREEPSDEPIIILMVKPDAHPDVAHEQGEMEAKESSAEESSSNTAKTEKLAVGLASSKASAANEFIEEHSIASAGESQEHAEHKDAHRMKARSEDMKINESKDQDPKSSSSTPAGGIPKTASSEEEGKPEGPQENKILADHSTQASASEDMHNADNKSTAHAIEDKQDPHPKEDAKVLVDAPTHAGESENKGSDKETNSSDKVPMDSPTQKQDHPESKGAVSKHN